MFANAQNGGTALGTPDVCLTPAVPAPVPIVYPNNASQALGTPAVNNVLFSSSPAHNLKTVVPTTSGDEPGVHGGVASGTVMGSSRHVTSVSAVLIGGAPATRMTGQTLQNSSNCQGTSLSPSQTKVLLLAT